MAAQTYKPEGVVNRLIVLNGPRTRSNALNGALGQTRPTSIECGPARRPGSKRTYLGAIILLIWLASGIGCLDLNGSDGGAIANSKPDSTNSSSHASRRNRAKPRAPHTGNRPPLRPWVVEGESADSGFAGLVGSAGDLNGDGFADVWGTELGHKSGTGRASVYYGSTAGLGSRPDWSAEGTPDTRPFGAWVEGLGDVDQDGYDDLAVLAEGGSDKATDQPPGNGDTVHFYRGSPSGLLLQAQWNLSAKQLSVIDILSVGRAGDVNGDGYADVYLLTIAKQPARRAYRVLILHGSPNGPSSVPDTYWDLDDPFAEVIPRLASAGDVNGDGYDDLLMGVPKWNGRSKARGRALVYHGSPQGLKATPAWTATYDLPAEKDVDEDYEQHFGWSVAAAGDVNHDGFADIIVGAPYADHGDANEGLAFAYYGSPTGLSREPQWTVESNHAHALLGWSVSGAGDVNGDGYDDVVVGVPYATDGQYNEGAALVFQGSKSGLHRSPDWSVESDATQAFLGKVVAPAGDVNGDGYADVLVASPDFTRNGQKVGRVHLFFGSSKGLPNSFHWNIDKPFLIAVQQRMERIPEARKLVALTALLTLSVLLFVAWRRTAARMLRAERENARTQERARLARDVHDRLGADLSHIALLGELAKSSPNRSEEAGNNLDQIARTARSALGSISELVWRLEPANDRLEHFAAYLEHLATKALLASELQLTLDMPDELPEATVSSAIRTELALMVTEVLRNVVEHAAASQVTIQLRIDSARPLHLRVIDNGRGFAVPTHLTTKCCPSTLRGNGLGNLQARAANLGGQVQIESTIGQGTQVTITVPLSYASSPL